MFGIKARRRGSYRNVLLTKKYAIKFPVFSSFEDFLRGILCNINEVKYSEINFKYLCPVLKSYLASIIIVMPIVNVDGSKETLERFWEDILEVPYSEQEMYKNIVEYKIDSIGYLNGRVVAVDYGH